MRFPRRTRRLIARAATGLRTLEGVRPVPEAQLHLTLRFIGEVDRSLEPPLARAVAAAAAAVDGFDLRLSGAGVFPSVRRARVLWVAVRPAPALSALQRAVEAAVAASGIAAEPRPFHAHVTVGRLRRAAAPGEVADAIARVRIETAVAVREVSLMRSKLSARGARHEEVAACPLAGGGAQGA